ncbi:hypothetical protein [Fructobacillus tropaeoli]|uniref:hypothetical protein n=1 Tax=Fructobacillus tropaeoli TaxID=709323 RepID=UPI002D99CE9B|nr:hypothetical protein LMG30238_FMBOGHMB_01600 [Fructobacillus tropaeoli]
MEKQHVERITKMWQKEQTRAIQLLFSITEKSRRRFAQAISFGGVALGMLASSTPVFADLKETTKSAGTDIFSYIFVGGIVLGVIIMGIGIAMWMTGSRSWTEGGQKKIFYAGAGIAGLFLVGLIVKFVIGVVQNGGGSMNPFSQLNF